MSLEECRLLCQEYHESLTALTDEQFLHGVIEAKKVCRFMPTPADIIMAYREAPSKRREQAALPMPDSCPDNWERQKSTARLFIRALEGDMRAREFFATKGAE